MSPTDRQAECLSALRRLTVDGVSPTIDTLAAELGYKSRGAIHATLLRLRDRRLITWERRRRQSIVILEDVVSPATLDRLSDEALRTTIAHCSGILAQRGGGRQDSRGPDPDSLSPAGRCSDGGLT